jgi:hypothetical protein
VLTRAAQPAPAPFDLTREAELRELIPPPSAAVGRKILPRLDVHGERFAAVTRLAAICLLCSDGRVDIGARAGTAGLATVSDGGKRLWIADTSEGRIGTALAAGAHGARAGVLLLVPGIGETLRANGSASVVSIPGALAAVFGTSAPPSAALRIDVEEIFFHCAKALVRSGLWHAAAEPERAREGSSVFRSSTLEPAHRAWLARSPFALLATCDERGRADVSPRGDPPGFVRVLDERTLLLPDRPGNRLLDSFRNALARPWVALLALVPGERGALRALGRAQLTSDPELLADSAVRDRRPLVGLRIELTEISLEHRAEPFVASELWEGTARLPRAALPTLGRVLIDQMGHRGLEGAIASRALDVALRRDERRNLY